MEVKFGDTVENQGDPGRTSALHNRPEVGQGEHHCPLPETRGGGVTDPGLVADGLQCPSVVLCLCSVYKVPLCGSLVQKVIGFENSRSQVGSGFSLNENLDRLLLPLILLKRMREDSAV